MLAGLEHDPSIRLGRWHGERAGLVSGEPSAHAGKQRLPSLTR
jgi:hypothetical protein